MRVKGIVFGFREQAQRHRVLECFLGDRVKGIVFGFRERAQRHRVFECFFRR